MRVVILAAGYGTRLYPLTRDLPKPLITINKKPIINFLIQKLDPLCSEFDIDEIKIVTNNKFYKHFLDWKKEYDLDVQIVNDGSNSPEDRLGAVGDINFVLNGDKNDDWLVVGGDNLFEDNLHGFLDYATAKRPFPVIGVQDVGTKEAASHYGVVELDRQRRIINFIEKPKIPKTTLAASCIYFFPKETVAFLDEYYKDKHCTDAAGKYVAWLVDKTKVFGYELKGEWIDVGQHQLLKLAEKKFAA